MGANILVAVVNSMGGNLNGPGILYIKSCEPGEPVETEHTHFARDRHAQNTRNYETTCRFRGCFWLQRNIHPLRKAYKYGKVNTVSGFSMQKPVK
jgi:hypothetical protein